MEREANILICFSFNQTAAAEWRTMAENILLSAIFMLIQLKKKA
jgi:hypothetical protein